MCEGTKLDGTTETNMAIRKSKRLDRIIQDKEEVIFDYVDKHGILTKDRRGEVHTMGYSKTGKSVIRAWDEGRQAWRLFRNSNITNLRLADEKYEYTRPGYNPKDRGMRHVVSSTKKVRLKARRKGS